MTDTDDDLPVRIDRREVNMAKRRERIVKAARDLIVETGTDSFSMKLLADRSDVSLATIYNLIGQKHDVLVQVFSTDLHKFYEELGTTEIDDPFEHTFKLIGAAARNLFRDHRYFRVLFSSLFSSNGYELVRLYQQPRAHFWVKMVETAVEQGLLLPGTKGSEVSHVLDDIYRSALIRWMWQTLDEPRFRAFLCHRFTIVLLGYATERGQNVLRPRLGTFYEELNGPNARRALPTAMTNGEAIADRQAEEPAPTSSPRGSSRRRSE